ncbi:MAG: acyl carrier protein [Sedimentisphaerales bacterium]|nr:acyl carrier protein [Sedimentisphaerales bacterium]
MSNIETIRGFVVENFLFGDGEQLTDDMSFLENGIIDSTGILEVISFLEETYGISIQDDELVPENLDSINNIAVFVENKLALVPDSQERHVG